MNDLNEQWEDRVLQLWNRIGEYGENDFVARIDRLAAELPPADPRAIFERACARDSSGRSDLAVPLYKAALDGGLSGTRRRRAVIQMSSSLRNLGRAQEAVAMLTDELNNENDALTGAVRAFLALALVDVGREREAVSVSLTALADYLPRYNGSLSRYARDLVVAESG